MKASSRAERPGLLDANFVSRLSSSQNISKLEAKRLETQWKRICDHEKRSKERNKELLKDFDRVEQHAALLAVKTERLKAYKQQYESYINKMYPRWKEELENHRLSQLQGRNALTGSASVAPPLTSSLPLRAAQLEPQFSGNTLLTSTPAHPPPPSSTVQDRLPPQTGYPVNQHHSYRQDPYREFSYHDPSRQHGGNLPPSGYLVSDRRWESPEYYDSHRHFDGRVHQGQFAASSREPENVYYRSPEHYSASPGGPFYDRRPPHREVPRNVPPDFRYMNPDVRHGPEPQGTRPAAPYEPRTELKRTFLPDRNQPAPYDQDGHHALYHDRKQGGYSGYEDQRPNGFEPHRMERGIVNGRDEAKFDKPFLSGFPTKVIVNGQDSKQLSTEAYSINQPFVPPEKPLERSIPTSGFPDPSLSSTVVETSVDSRNTHHDHEMKEDKSFTTPTTSEATPNEALVKPAKETIVKQQSLPSEEITKLSEEVRTRGVEPVKSVGIPQEGNQNNTGIDLEGGKDEKPKDKVALTLQQSNKLEEQSDEDDEESLDLSDLSLPDGKKEGLPIIPSQKQPVRHEDKQEETNVFHRDSEVSGGTTNPVVVPDATKSVTEDISEDIPESMALDGDEELNDVPVHDEGEVRLTSSGGQVAEHAKEFEVSKDVNDEREEDKNEVQAKDEMETPAQKNEEEKTSSVSVDGFLCLLQAVDADVEVSFSPETLYRSPPCSSDMRDEIIRAAEVGDSLQSFDPNTVSMVVLEELPLLVSSSPAGCLIPDRVFSEGASFKTEKELRSFAESSLIKLWKALFSHLVNVVKNNVMRAEQVGNMFGSLLIAKSSKHWKESQLLLCRILEAAISDVSSQSASPPPSPKDHDLDLETRFETEDAFEQEQDEVSIVSGGSSSTLGSTPPKVDLNKSNEGDRKTAPDPKVSYEDDFEDDVPLTETAAYLKMMSSAHSEPDDDISDLLGNSGPQKQDSEADDDVERELARTISPPVTSPRQRSPNNLKIAKQKPKLSLFETGTEVENAEKDLGDSWGGSSVKSVKSDISDSESVVSPPLSPDFGVGYTPTALENNEPSNKVDKENDKSEPKSASDSKAKRKTDFWNTSDTESEVDLQLSTGGLDQDDDDFDFYG